MQALSILSVYICKIGTWRKVGESNKKIKTGNEIFQTKL